MVPKGKRPPLFERLKTSLEEGIQFSRGNFSLRTTELPPPPPLLAPKEVLALRKQIRMSQTGFAQLLNVSQKTVQNWEKGLRKPTHAALCLLQVIRIKPGILLDLLLAE